MGGVYLPRRGGRRGEGGGGKNSESQGADRVGRFSLQLNTTAADFYWLAHLQPEEELIREISRSSLLDEMKIWSLSGRDAQGWEQLIHVVTGRCEGTAFSV